jgi:hypothetical protein
MESKFGVSMFRCVPPFPKVNHTKRPAQTSENRPVTIIQVLRFFVTGKIKSIRFRKSFLTNLIK